MLQHYWDLTIRSFNVISRTLIGRGSLIPLQISSWCILQSQPTGWEEDWIHACVHRHSWPEYELSKLIFFSAVIVTRLPVLLHDKKSVGFPFRKLEILLCALVEMIKKTKRGGFLCLEIVFLSWNILTQQNIQTYISGCLTRIAIWIKMMSCWPHINKHEIFEKVFYENHIQYLRWVMTFSERD